jgi:hypothetical protein
MRMGSSVSEPHPTPFGTVAHCFYGFSPMTFETEGSMASAQMW